MHELAVTESVLKIAIEHAEQAGAERITSVTLVIGDMSSFVDDSIQFYFDLLTPGTLAEGAQLHFKRIAIQFRCRSCGEEFELQGRDWTCPKCSALGGTVIAGKEFYIESIIVKSEK